MDTPTPDKVFHQPIEIGTAATECVTIRFLPSELMALDAFVRSESDCGSRRQLICEALEYYLEQPKGAREAYRKHLTETNGGKNPHRKLGGRPKGRRNNPRPRVPRPAKAAVVAVEASGGKTAVSGGKKPATAAGKAQAGGKSVQRKLATGGSDGW